MIRCAWCGARNYAIDMWCTRCHRHLDWQPMKRRRGALATVLPPAAAAVGVAIALALPAAGWFNGSFQLRLAMFYAAVSGHEFALAAALWSPQLKAADPPAVFIDQRFSATQQIGVRGERIMAHEAGSAVVYVDLLELIGGQTREWVGTWQLIQSPSGWLLNSPDLRGA
ncbi:MAG: hypothetical protein E6I56_11120 [Chloroflexi bacterium]|nr:MAG: hypothetical protein E6I56_11120 [Chloroflexota bacterium]